MKRKYRNQSHKNRKTRIISVLKKQKQKKQKMTPKKQKQKKQKMTPKKHKQKKQKMTPKQKKLNKTLRINSRGQTGYTKNDRYINELNELLKLVYRGKIDDIFNDDDHILETSGYLEKGITRAKTLLQQKNLLLDVGCNSVCMMIAMISWFIHQKRKLNISEKIFIFCVEYLSKEDELEEANIGLPESYAKLKLDKEMEYIQSYYDKKLEAGASARDLKRAQKNIDKTKVKHENILSGYGRETSTVENLDIDLCNEVDCTYIYEDDMKTAEMKKSVSTLCKYMNEIFKGSILKCFEDLLGAELKKYVSGDHKNSSEEQIIVDIDVQDILFDTHAVILPPSQSYQEGMDEDGYIEEWVYLCISNSRKIEKVSLDRLKTNTYYMVAKIDEEFMNSSFEQSKLEETSHTNIGAYIDELIMGSKDSIFGKLNHVAISERKLGNGTSVPNIDEIFTGDMNEIIEHWFVASSTTIDDMCVDMSFRLIE